MGECGDAEGPGDRRSAGGGVETAFGAKWKREVSDKKERGRERGDTSPFTKSALGAMIVQETYGRRLLTGRNSGCGILYLGEIG